MLYHSYKFSIIDPTNQNYVPFHTTCSYNLSNAQLVPSHPGPFHPVNHSIQNSFGTSNQTLHSITIQKIVGPEPELKQISHITCVTDGWIPPTDFCSQRGERRVSISSILHGLTRFALMLALRFQWMSSSKHANIHLASTKFGYYQKI
jgi:hypothetical protein